MSGEELTSSIDIDLQQYAESLMMNKIGSIVAIEPSSGEILTMVSSPSYDPNMLTGREFPINFGPLQKDPLFLYTTVRFRRYTGQALSLNWYNRWWACSKVLLIVQLICLMLDLWAAINHSGAHNGMHNAIQYSCNVYFYQAFRQLYLP